MLRLSASCNLALDFACVITSPGHRWLPSFLHGCIFVSTQYLALNGFTGHRRCWDEKPDLPSRRFESWRGGHRCPANRRAAQAGGVGAMGLGALGFLSGGLGLVRGGALQGRCQVEETA